MTSMSFANPFSQAVALVDDYRAHVEQHIAREIDDAPLAAQVVEDVFGSGGAGGQLLAERVWLTLRREYVPGPRLHELCAELGLNASLADAVVAILGPNARLHAHQATAIRSILDGKATAIATGTGSGKTESFLIPALHLALGTPSESGVKVVIVYPRNALAYDQLDRVKRYAGALGLRAEQYTGDTVTSHAALEKNPPDILLTNHVMLDRILTNLERRSLVGIGTLKMIVLDEIHVFEGAVGADVAWLVRRLKHEVGTNPVVVGASATIGLGEPTDRFLRTLFDAADVHVVQPEYQPFGGIPSPLGTLGGLAGFPAGSLEALDKRALKEVGVALGASPEWSRECTRAMLANPGEFDRLWASFLRSNPIACRWHAELERGAASFGTLIQVAEQELELSGNRREDAAAYSRILLSAILYNAKHAKDSPAPITPAIHLCLDDLGGPITLCLSCGRYGIGVRIACGNCGGPVLHADLAHPGCCVAVAGRWRMDGISVPGLHGAERELGVSRSQVRYRISLAGEARGDGFAASLRLRAQREEDGGAFYEIEPDPSAPFWLATEHDEDAARTLRVRMGYGEQLGPAWLLRTLQGYSPNHPKTLVFVDSRDRAAREGHLLGADAARRHLLHLARICLTEGQADSVAGLPEALESRLKTVAGQSKSHADLLKYIPIWCARLCSSAGQPLELRRELRDELDDGETVLVSVAIETAAVDWPSVLGGRVERRDPADFYETDHNWSTRPGYLVLQSGVTKPSGIRLRILTEDPSATYRHQVSELGGSAEVETIANRLVAKGVFVCRMGSEIGLAPEYGDVSVFCLSMDCLVLSGDSERWPDDPVFRPAGTHTADQHLRAELQERFASGDIATLCATSTMELGVDVGELRQVVMLGIPPSPASYAQRTGRAGRGKNRYSLGVVWLHPWLPLDQLMIQYPGELARLIGGSVDAPRIDLSSSSVRARHVLAMALRGLEPDAGKVIGLLADPAAAYEVLRQKLLDVFGNLSAEEFLDCVHALAKVHKARSEPAGHSSARELMWYSTSMAPAFGIAKDQVELVSAENHIVLLSSRSAHDAVRQWAPGKVVAIPSEVVRIQDCASREMVESPVGKFATYSRFYGEPLDIDERGEPHFSSRVVTFVSGYQPSTLPSPGWFQVGRIHEGLAVFRNLDPESGVTRWGVTRTADAFVVVLDEVLLGSSAVDSVLCVLHRVAQRILGTTSTELLPAVARGPEAEGDYTLAECHDGFAACMLLDLSGRGVVDWERLERELAEGLDHEIGVLRQCPDVTDGCMACLFAVETLSAAPGATRSRGIELAAAIADQLRKVASPRLAAPELPREQHAAARRDARVLGIDHHGTKVEWTLGEHRGETAVRPDDAYPIKQAVAEALRCAIDAAGVDSPIRITSNLPWLPKLLAGGRLRGKLDSGQRLIIDQGMRARFVTEH